MIYQNPQPEEGINYSKEHPLKEFAQLLAGVAVFITLSIFALTYVASSLARHIPFEFEQKMVAGFDFSNLGDLLQDDPAGEQEPSASTNREQSANREPSAEESSTSANKEPSASQWPSANKEPSSSNTRLAQQAHLQQLADKLAAVMQLPNGMQITVHYDDAEMVNAFATLGGNLIFFAGLVNKMESEDELAAVMAHEIAHVKYRHPVVALGKGLTLAALAAFISGSSGSAAGEWLIGNSVNLSMLKFSRDQESQADADATAALAAVYGHVGGADRLFRRFSELEGPDSGMKSGVEMFRSHPYSEKRWLALQTLARDNNWSTSGSLSPLQFPGLK